MKKALATARLAAAPFVTQAAQASDLGYTYVEANYQAAEIDVEGGDDFKLKGYAVNGSLEIGQTPLYVFGGYRQADETTYGSYYGDYRLTDDVEQFHIGAGYAYAITERLNLLTEVSHVTTRITNDYVWDDGYTEQDKSRGTDLRAAVGVDALLADSLEGWGKAYFTHGDSFKDEDGNNEGKFGAVVGMQYKFTPNWGVTAQVDYNSDLTVYGVGVRASF